MSLVVSRLLLSLLILLSLASGQVYADNQLAQSSQSSGASFSFGGYYWQQNYSGDFKISEFDIRPVGVESDLSIKRDSNFVYFTELSHKLPYIPQLRLQKTAIQSVKNTRIKPSRFFSLGGSSNLFNDLRSIRAEMDFGHTDLNIFFQIWDLSNKKSHANIGVTLRKFSGYTFVTTTDDNLAKCSSWVLDFSVCPVAYRLDFNDRVPLFYLTANIDLGIPHVVFNTRLHYGNYKKNEMTDIDINFAYRLPIKLSLHLGYRHAILDLGDFSGLVADITTNGFYSGFSFSF